MFLYHNDVEPVVAVIGTTTYELPPNEPVEVLPDHNANIIVGEKRYHGVVRVAATKSKTGISFDLETAAAESAVLRETEEDRIVRDYINTQLEDRLRKNFPALPPSDRVAAIISRRGIDLAAYGIVPVGRKVAAHPDVDELRRENAELKSRLDELVAKLGMKEEKKGRSRAAGQATEAE